MQNDCGNEVMKLQNENLRNHEFSFSLYSKCKCKIVKEKLIH